MLTPSYGLDGADNYEVTVRVPGEPRYMTWRQARPRLSDAIRPLFDAVLRAAIEFDAEGGGVRTLFIAVVEGADYLLTREVSDLNVGSVYGRYRLQGETLACEVVGSGLMSEILLAHEDDGA